MEIDFTNGYHLAYDCARKLGKISLTNELDQNLTKKLFHSMKEVLATAVDQKAKPEELPDSYLLPRRVKSGKCPKCGNALHKITVSGRTGYYCKHCQPEPEPN